MAFFFRRALSLVERFESALEDKQAAREKLADRLSAAETALGEKRAAAERFAMADAADAQLDRAEVAIRAAEDRVKTLKAALAQVDEQIADAERELVDAKAQRARDMTASELEKMAAAIEHAAPRYDAAAIALIEAITKSPASLQEATSFANHLDAVRREVDSAAALICSELRAAAVRTRAGNSNFAFCEPPDSKPSPPDIKRELIYTLDPLLWREGSKVRRVPPFAQIELPKTLLAVALRHQHVDYLSAARVRNLMQIYGNGKSGSAPHADDPRLVDLDALAAQEKSAAQANVA